jgi:hypothetical protein
MKSPLDRLTDARLAAIRDNWIAIGLSTDPADRRRAEAGVRLAYRRAGLCDTIRMIWTASPMSGAIVADSLVRRASRPRTVANIVKPVAAPPRDALKPVPPDLSARIRLAVMEPVAYVTEQVRRPINEQIARFVRPTLPGYGQHDVPWLAYADALGQIGADVSATDASAEIARSCGWWWPFDDVCVLSERHSQLARDERGRLHASNGPAVVYSDGWAIYAWHGIAVDASPVLDAGLRSPC